MICDVSSLVPLEPLLHPCIVEKGWYLHRVYISSVIAPLRRTSLLHTLHAIVSLVLIVLWSNFAGFWPLQHLLKVDGGVQGLSGVLHLVALVYLTGLNLVSAAFAVRVTELWLCVFDCMADLHQARCRLGLAEATNSDVLCEHALVRRRWVANHVDSLVVYVQCLLGCCCVLRGGCLFPQVAHTWLLLPRGRLEQLMVRRQVVALTRRNELRLVEWVLLLIRELLHLPSGHDLTGGEVRLGRVRVLHARSTQMSVLLSRHSLVEFAPSANRRLWRCVRLHFKIYLVLFYFIDN